MAKGYWIARVDVHNKDGYKAYAADNRAVFKKFGGRFIVRGGKFKAIEGQSRSRNVVIEFQGLRDRAGLLQFAGIPGQHRCGSRIRRPTS